MSFLNNLLTQNVENLLGPRYAALLSPQGKVIADMILWPDGQDVLLETSTERSAGLMHRLSMYKLRAQVAVDDASEAVGVVWSAGSFTGAFADPRLTDGALGYRKLAVRDSTSGLSDGSGLYDAQRISAGIPDLARDVQPEEVFAGEALLEELNGVDFQKGCFIGQENVSRMKRRATTRKKLCPISFDGPPLPFGAAVKAGEAEIGTVRSGTEGRAIVLVRLDRAIEVSENGVPLTAEDHQVQLDPPPWLILPPREEA